MRIADGHPQHTPGAVEDYAEAAVGLGRESGDLARELVRERARGFDTPSIQTFRCPDLSLLETESFPVNLDHRSVETLSV